MAPAIFAIGSALLLAAHFLRRGEWLLAAFAVAAPWLLCSRNPWARRLLQVVLGLGALEWLRTAIFFVQVRRMTGEPWMRLAVILGAVTVFTAVAALVVGRTGRRPPADPARVDSPAT